ncbi:MAG: hypothetical protein A3G34_00145 [Candidatus Lindowbacteria bacterium RIFCSPLOWO2_12_FULL_62_27]|nr:MAG: hypothetical protein A3G34_00145 [Candidatus Lindowbacteria bacterium RIFCSPLOWO2_12_FULL_62_27]OGH56695.1 MAG: hypothetical protein A3I06_07585 [Candidatus Lindowbacteria bacterium RIFCSPLOWO2_02_FULL_62_12]
MLSFGYRILFLMGLVVSSPYWLWRAWKKRELGTIPERLGITGIQFPKSKIKNQKSKISGSIWVHAVSVGEVLAAQPLIHAIRTMDPSRGVTLSVTTRTGLELAGRALAPDDAVEGPLMFPLDLPWAVARRLREIRPAALVLIDTELWPCLIERASRNGVRLFLANGRISDRSFPRYALVKFFLKPLLSRFSRLWMQSKLDADRILALGAPTDRVHVGGNLKIDAMVLNERRAGAGAAGSGPVRIDPDAPPLLLAASTHPGEEEVMLEAAKAWKSQGRSFRLALAPRHPERAKEVRARIEAHGFRPILRSMIRPSPGDVDTAWPAVAGASDVLLIDTIGELTRVFFPRASVVFVGGSLVPVGGHNIFEPAAFGRPILFGPHMENFRDAEEALADRGALRVTSKEAFAGAAAPILFDRDRAERMGRQAREAFDSLQGAAGRIAAELLETMTA